MDPRTGGEMPQNCTVEASPVFPGPNLPPPTLNPQTHAKWDQTKGFTNANDTVHPPA